MSRSVSAVAGAFIVVGMRWTDRLIGFVSTIILARLLVPEDFGIIAMASLVIGLIDVLLDMGVNITLVQNKHATQDDYDAAWTLRLIQSSLATVVMLIAAFPAADYFHDERVTSVVQVLALSVLLLGLENIGIVSFQKKMEFGQEFRFFFAKRIVGFVFTIVSAWYLHSYWALVIGTMAGRTFGVVLSYVIHPMRPRLSWIRMGAMLSFSTWNLARGISGYLGENLHRMLVGRRENSTVMGAYTLASDIAAMPSSELLAPLNRVLFPMFVSAKDNPQELKRMYLLALGLQAMVGVPAGVGLAMVAPELVMAMLGEKWMMAVPFVQIMGGVNIISALGTSGGYVLLACGKARIIALQSWGQVALFLTGCMLLIPQGGAMAIAEMRMGVATIGLWTTAYLILRDQPTWRVMEMLKSVWRPCVAVFAMYAVLSSVRFPSDISVVYQLFLKITLGTTAFVGVVGMLWQLWGRPEGTERYLLNKIWRVVRR